MLKYKIL